MPPQNENNYWATIKNSLWIAEHSLYETFDIAMGVHLGESVVAGVTTAAAMKRGNVAARYLMPKSARPESRLFRTVVHGTNAAAGLAATALTSHCLTSEADKRELTNRIVHAPLMPELSPSSDIFCDRVMEACKRNEKEISPEVKAFAENCQLRRDFEAKLRKKQDLPDGDPVSIPFMGVPTKAPLDESVIAMKVKYLIWGDIIVTPEISDSTEEEDRLCFEDVLDMKGAVIVVGLATFLSLRKAPSRILLRVRPFRNAIIAKRYSLDPPPKAKRNVLIRATKLAFQVGVSLYVGLLCGALREYYNGRLPQHVVESPLVAGGSIISNDMCEDIVKEYAHMQSSFAKSDHQSLRHLSAAIHNCQQRQAYEQQLRQAKGLAKDAQVSIPPPGVPNGITRDAIDKAWGESLVTDHVEVDAAASNDNAPQQPSK